MHEDRCWLVDLAVAPAAMQTAAQALAGTRERQRHNICKCYPILYIPSTRLWLYQLLYSFHELIQENIELYVKD